MGLNRTSLSSNECTNIIIRMWVESYVDVRWGW